MSSQISPSFCTFTSYYNRPPPPPAQDLIPPVKRSYPPHGGSSLPPLYYYDIDIGNQTTLETYNDLDPQYHYLSRPLPGALGQGLIDAVKKGCKVTDPFPLNLSYTPVLDAGAPGQPNIPAYTNFEFNMAFLLPQSVGKDCVEEAIKESEHQDVKCIANVTSELPQAPWIDPLTQ